MLCMGIVIMILTLGVKEFLGASAKYACYIHHLPGILLEDLGGREFYNKTWIYYAAKCKPCMYLKIYKRSFERCHAFSGLLLATPPDPWGLDM